MAVARPEFSADEARALLDLLRRQSSSDHTLQLARHEMERAVARVDLLEAIARRRREFSIKHHPAERKPR